MGDVTRTRARRFRQAASALLVGLCLSTAFAERPLIGFYVGERSPGPGLSAITVPGSGKQLFVTDSPALDLGAIDAVEAIEADDPDTVGIELILSDAGVKALGDTTRAALGKHLVLMLGEEVVEAFPIEVAIAVKRFRLRGIPRASVEGILSTLTAQ